MWFAGGGGALRKLCRATAVLENEMIGNSMFVRYMSRERAVNVRKINPKVPIQEAYVISNSLYDVFKKHGPLSVPNTWLRAQEAGVSGINSKTHMKLLLKWMRGRKMLKLICNQVGSSKKFFHTILTEDPQQETPPVAAPTENNKNKNKNKKSKQTSKRRSK
uniref:Tumor necrosis factor receptor superfamily member 21 n=1 Tax=Noccaea caerulescens TaxID=107243 RepID=A0A1J3FFX5_NOCCA